VYCDALTLAAVADELRHKLLGGRIQRVLLVDRLMIGLEVYAHRQRHYLLISAQPEEGGRLHLMQYRLRRGLETPTPLLLRLRKYARGGRITDIQQPPAERLLQLSIEGKEGVVVLIAEVMGKRSNIILTEEDSTILECAKHVPASQNRYRVLLPGHPYILPPAQKKVEAGALTPGRLTKLLEDQDAKHLLWQKLVGSVRGVSPLLAREVVFRASGDVECPDADAHAVLAQLSELLSLSKTGQWQPTVALQGGEIVAYAPYLLTHYPRHERRASISQAMAPYYARRVGADGYATARNRLQKVIDEQKGRQFRKRQALLRAQPAPGTLDELRRNGELLLAYAHQVSPAQSELVVRLSATQPPVQIALDPIKSAVENAQEYFRRYEKAKSAAAEVPRILARVDGELAHLEQLSTDLALAEDQPGIAGVESALAEAGYVPKPKGRRRPTAGPLRALSDEGFVILVGRSSWQNEEVTFRRSAGHDVWLHARGAPGGHVLIRTEGRDVPEATLLRAAELAAHFSAVRHEQSIPVDYTLRRNVRRLRGGKPGQVVYKAQKTLIVRPKD
jgi:predicted ribosome quality control (RQC) complex YloA/Tae2 family protein